MLTADLPPLIEPIAVPDIYISGLASIEEVGGGNYRLTCFTRQASFTDGHAECIVTLRFVVPGEAIPPAVFMVSKGIGMKMIAELPSFR